MAGSALLVEELNRIGKKAEKGVSLGAKEFNAVIKDFADNLLPRQFLFFHKWLALELLTRTVLKTPVDLGRARGNWQISVDVPIDDETTREDRSGEPTIAAENAKLAAAYFGCVIWLTNNLPYIIQLEGGWSGQAPVGMLALSLEEIAQGFRRVP